MIQYVVGFLFSNDGRDVVLIKKQHPDWQKGRLNGIGGTCKAGETAMDAMIREFEEESGLYIESWQIFLQCEDKDRKIILYCFRAYSDEIYKAKTVTDETITIVNAELASNLSIQSMIGNLRVLLRMAIDDNFMSGKMYVNLDRS